MNSAPGAPAPASCTLVFLSYDEAEALARLLPMTPLSLFDRVIAVDGGSTDGTLDLYRRAGIECFVQKRPGRGNAFLEAQELVATELVVFFSADGNEDPGDLPRILAELRSGCDQVIAGRFALPGACDDASDDPLGLRRAGARAFALLVRLTWGAKIHDATNGYRGFRLDSMKRLRLDAAGHDIEYQATIRATRLGMRVREIATRELARLGGTRKATAGTWALGWVTLLRYLKELVAGGAFLRSGG